MIDTKLRATEFIDQLTSKYLIETSELNETECYQSFFNLTRMQRSFQSEIHRSQVPLENCLIELKEKFYGINNTINLCQDLADSRYSICKLSNKNDVCEEEMDVWMEGIVSSVRCQIIQNCSSHVLSKRSTNNKCRIGTFVCGSGECISPSLVCDRNSDCNDGTDEIECCNRYRNRMHCRRTDTCMENSMICDGKDDCGDGLDERNCGRMTTPCSVEYGTHKCDFGSCIGLDQVCDGYRDCNDTSDEGDQCGLGLCPEECTKKGGVCFFGPEGPLCFTQCPLGTFETPEGCSPYPQPTNRTVLQLLEDIPKLSYRQSTKFAYFKMKATNRVSKMMNDIFKCLDPDYPNLAKVIRFPINNQTVDESYPSKSDVTTENPLSG